MGTLSEIHQDMTELLEANDKSFFKEMNRLHGLSDTGIIELGFIYFKEAKYKLAMAKINEITKSIRKEVSEALVLCECHNADGCLHAINAHLDGLESV